MLGNIIHIHPLATIRRERVLPQDGKILVRKGQKIAATEYIAEGDLTPEHLLLDISRGLGLPVKKADQHLQCKPGMDVSEGDILAGPVGFGKRVVRSPQPGRVIIAGDGQVLIKVKTQPSRIKAGIPGTIMELVGDRGVIIESFGAIIQGEWGNGKIENGVLTVVTSSPDEVLKPQNFAIGLGGAIVLGSIVLDKETLDAAIESQVKGLILASMDVALLPVAERLPISVILLEGFGHIPMNSIAFRILTTNERREVAINAESWDRFNGNRPEIIIPLPVESEAPQLREVAHFSQGQTVRVVRAPFRGKTGILVKVRESATVLENGITTQAGIVSFDSGEQSLVPLENLEIIE